MNSGHWLQILGLIIGFVGALLLTITEIKRRESIDAESGTYFDYNPAIREDLKQKSLLAIFSTVLLAVGFVLQLIGFGIS